MSGPGSRTARELKASPRNDLKFLHSILSLKLLYKTEHQAEVKTHVHRRVKMRGDFIIVVYKINKQ